MEFHRCAAQITASPILSHALNHRLSFSRDNVFCVTFSNSIVFVRKYLPFVSFDEFINRSETKARRRQSMDFETNFLSSRVHGPTEKDVDCRICCFDSSAHERHAHAEDFIFINFNIW